MLKIPLPLLLARLGLAACFLGFGVWEVIAPRLWTVYVPAVLSNMMNPVTLVFIHGVGLTVTALGVLSGYFPRFFTGLATLMLLEICVEIFIQEGFTDVFIRDIALLLFTCALFADAWRGKRV